MSALFILLTAHFLADFYFQTEAIAKNKGRKFRYLLLHAVIYAITLYLGAILSVHPLQALLPITVVSLAHFAIDWLKIVTDRHLNTPRTHLYSFCIDQLIHIAIILIAYFGCLRFSPPAPWWSSLASYPLLHEYIVYALIVLLCLKPPAILISRLLACFEPKDSEPQAPDKGGYLIGLLERLIVAILIINGHIGEIAFVLTAKSVARFKEFEKSGFAEKFLIGTMASISFALAVSLLLMRFIPS
jgi:hypothetical protein